MAQGLQYGTHLGEGGGALRMHQTILSPVLPQDISSLARALLTVPVQERCGFCRDLFDHATRASTHVANTGQLHSLWGNGTLDAVARCFPLEKEPFWDDPTYLNCLLVVLQELQRRLSL